MFHRFTTDTRGHHVTGRIYRNTMGATAESTDRGTGTGDRRGAIESERTGDGRGEGGHVGVTGGSEREGGFAGETTDADVDR